MRSCVVRSERSGCVDVLGSTHRRSLSSHATMLSRTACGSELTVRGSAPAGPNPRRHLAVRGGLEMRPTLGQCRSRISTWLFKRLLHLGARAHGPTCEASYVARFPKRSGGRFSSTLSRAVRGELEDLGSRPVRNA